MTRKKMARVIKYLTADQVSKYDIRRDAGRFIRRWSVGRIVKHENAPGIRFSTGFPNPLTHPRRRRRAGSPRFFARRAERFDLCATLKGRLLYLRAALSSHQSSARKKSLCRAPALYAIARRAYVNCTEHSIHTRCTYAFRDKTPYEIIPTFIERLSAPWRASFNPHCGGLIWSNPF